MMQIVLITTAIIWFALGLLNGAKYMGAGEPGDIIFGLFLFLAASIGAGILMMLSIGYDPKRKRKE